MHSNPHKDKGRPPLCGTHWGMYTHVTTHTVHKHYMDAFAYSTPLILRYLCIWHYLRHTSRRGKHMQRYTHTKTLSRYLQCSARSEASGLSGNRTFFISCLSSPCENCGWACVLCVCVCVCRISPAVTPSAIPLHVAMMSIFLQASRFISNPDRIKTQEAVFLAPPPFLFPSRPSASSACHFPSPSGAETVDYYMYTEPQGPDM